MICLFHVVSSSSNLRDPGRHTRLCDPLADRSVHRILTTEALDRPICRGSWFGSPRPDEQLRSHRIELEHPNYVNWEWSNTKYFRTGFQDHRGGFPSCGPKSQVPALPAPSDRSHVVPSRSTRPPVTVCCHGLEAAAYLTFLECEDGGDRGRRELFRSSVKSRSNHVTQTRPVWNCHRTAAPLTP